MEITIKTDDGTCYTIGITTESESKPKCCVCALPVDKPKTMCSECKKDEYFPLDK